jgi:acetyl esterase/lipase
VLSSKFLFSVHPVVKQAQCKCDCPQAMTINTLTVGAAVTPTVVKTYITHVQPHTPNSERILTEEKYIDRKSRYQKPTAHISYDEGLHLIRSFLEFASHRTVEELQAFTSQWVPNPRWVKVDNVTIPIEHITKAADVLAEHLGHKGLNKIGGSKWWQWRQNGSELKAEWIEMRAHFNERKKLNEKCSRVMLYIHGGAYFFGSVDEQRYQMQRHARKLKARVFAPRYRLAPQFPFPCGLQDCLAAYLYLLTLHDPTEILLAGDSAGGGMTVSILCILRDQGFPLPAGATLISPWVDLTHSFPSLGADDALDYIPPHGFMQKPSISWPPPNDDEILAIGKQAAKTLHGNSTRKSAEIEAVQGLAIVESTGSAHLEEAASQNPNHPARPDRPDSEVRPGNSSHNISIEIDGVRIRLKDQIQMYTTNQLISHPLVSPVLQPSLGGLPPILILTGGGEVLRDEQIFLAHKAARPADPRYQPGAYQAEYDPDGSIAKKWAEHPTPVQLQVWDDLCHVAPTLSFTRPAKFMYRSVAQFGAWALARAQQAGVEIVDDDQISVISSGSDTGTDSDKEVESERTDSLVADKKASEHQSNGRMVHGAHSGSSNARASASSAHIGKAGSPLPAFKHHMIRQRVDRHGIIFPLAPENELPALQMDRNDVGVIKPGPVRKWMAAKAEWDEKFARQKRAVLKRRVKEMARGRSFGQGENPPPSALAGRGREKDEVGAKVRKGRKGIGMAMWSLWGSKHDESTMKREEEVVKREEEEVEREGRSRRGTGSSGATRESTAIKIEERVLGRRISGVGNVVLPSAGEGEDDGAQGEKERPRSRSRRRTTTVIDRGQVEGFDSAIDSRPSGDQELTVPSLTDMDADGTAAQQHDAAPATEAIPDPTHLSPLFLPKFKSRHSYLKPEPRDDASSMRSTATGGVESDNASTMAVFAVPGVIVDSAESNLHDDGADTPGSKRSVERLRSHQVYGDGDGEEMARVQALRSSSAVAVMRAEGVVGVFTEK